MSYSNPFGYSFPGMQSPWGQQGQGQWQWGQQNQGSQGQGLFNSGALGFGGQTGGGINWDTLFGSPPGGEIWGPMNGSPQPTGPQTGGPLTVQPPATPNPTGSMTVQQLMSMYPNGFGSMSGLSGLTGGFTGSTPANTTPPSSTAPGRPYTNMWTPQSVYNDIYGY